MPRHPLPTPRELCGRPPLAWLAGEGALEARSGGAGQAGERPTDGGPRNLHSASPLESLASMPLEILKLRFQCNYILMKWNKGMGLQGAFQSCFFPASHSLRGSELSPLRRPGPTALQSSQNLPQTQGQQVVLEYTQCWAHILALAACTPIYLPPPNPEGHT